MRGFCVLIGRQRLRCSLYFCGGCCWAVVSAFAPAVLCRPFSATWLAPSLSRALVLSFTPPWVLAIALAPVLSFFRSWLHLGQHYSASFALPPSPAASALLPPFFPFSLSQHLWLFDCQRWSLAVLPGGPLS